MRGVVLKSEKKKGGGVFWPEEKGWWKATKDKHLLHVYSKMLGIF